MLHNQAKQSQENFYIYCEIVAILINMGDGDRYSDDLKNLLHNSELSLDKRITAAENLGRLGNCAMVGDYIAEFVGESTTRINMNDVDLGALDDLAKICPIVLDTIMIIAEDNEMDWFMRILACHYIVDQLLDTEKSGL